MAHLEVGGSLCPVYCCTWHHARRHARRRPPVDQLWLSRLPCASWGHRKTSSTHPPCTRNADLLLCIVTHGNSKHRTCKARSPGCVANEPFAGGHAIARRARRTTSLAAPMKAPTEGQLAAHKQDGALLPPSARAASQLPPAQYRGNPTESLWAAHQQRGLPQPPHAHTAPPPLRSPRPPPAAS